MVLSPSDAAIGIVVTAVLAAVAVRMQALTLRGGSVAFVFGSLIVTIAGFPFLALLALFVLASVLATRFQFDEKARRHVQEGTRGERGVSNVLAHIVIPAALVVTAFLVPSTLPAGALAVLYASALAFGSSDTFASEFGVLAGGARSILTGKPVTPGTNGGISAAGEVWGLIGAFLTASVGLGLFSIFNAPSGSPTLLLVIVTAAGFIGCQVDSIIGEVFENRGLLSKGGTNFAAMAATVIVAIVLLRLSGGWS